MGSLGCLSFALLFDDIEPELRVEDREMFKTFANAQAHVTNEIYHHLKAPSLFMFCPTGNVFQLPTNRTVRSYTVNNSSA